MKKFTALLLVVLLIGVIALTGCAPKEETDVAGDQKEEADVAVDDVIKIGVFQPLSGANAAGGELEMKGLYLAQELFPEVLGKRVELIVYDNRSDAIETANVVTRLVDHHRVPLIIGCWGSTFAIAAGPIIEAAGVPTIGTSCTNPLVTLGKDYYFRVTFIDSFQGVVMAKYTYEEVGAKKVAVIQEIGNDYSVALAKFYKDAFVELTGDDEAIVMVMNYQTGDQDFSAQLTAIKDSDAEAIFAPGNFTESALIMKQARELGIDLPFVGADTWETPELIEIGGDAVEGAVFSTFFASEVPMTHNSEVFLNAYREKYGEEPAAVAALAFDAYLVALDAITRAGTTTDSAAIRDALAATDAFPGAAGTISFDENGDAVKSAVIKEIRDGEFTFLTIVDPF